jgi:hypothetical protein
MEKSFKKGGEMNGNEPWDVWKKAKRQNPKLQWIEIDLTNHEQMNLYLLSEDYGIGLCPKNQDLTKSFELENSDLYGERGKELFAKYKPDFGYVWVHANNFEEPREFESYIDFLNAVEKQRI